MRIKLFHFCLKVRSLIRLELGQDIVEYALVMGLVAFGAAAGMGTVASGINTVLNNLGNTVVSHTS